MAVMQDFREQDGYYVFRWKARGEEFYQRLRELKALIPLEQRRFDSETKLWSVEVTDQNERTLKLLFENGESCIETTKSQLKLF